VTDQAVAPVAAGISEPRELLGLDDLSVTFVGRAGNAVAVRSVDLSVPAGSTYGIVGESGSGK
jgi:ABC-type dipeptide/oligopeptide/nickel transport system ATPase component